MTEFEEIIDLTAVKYGVTRNLKLIFNMKTLFIIIRVLMVLAGLFTLSVWITTPYPSIITAIFGVMGVMLIVIGLLGKEVFK